jgi:hypothetical protein
MGLGAGVLPAEAVDQMVHVLFEELVDHCKGIFIRRRVEIEGAAEEMVGCVRDKELFGRSCIAADVKEDPSYPVAGYKGGVFDGAGLITVLESELEGVVAQLVKFVGAYHFVTDIDACAEAGEVDIYPPRVLGHGIEISAVLQDIGIDRILEAVGEAGLVKGLILMGREINFKIAPPLGGVNRVTGEEKGEDEDQRCETGYRHDVDFWFRTACEWPLLPFLCGCCLPRAR